ncbi:ABC transporter ATP-binding protein [Rhizobium sp. ZPR3]|uniref:ABC transporter ATP-binding protein n=2 Tax=unclassified Rhizobium TaxID=2613769 RepID=A0AAU7SQK8_9HYPH
MQPFFQIKDLELQIERGGRTAMLLNGVNLDIERGEAVGVVGESGCGKSITWLAVLGVLGQQMRVTGRALLEGRDLLAIKAQEMTKIRGKRIAMIFQDPTSSLNPIRTVGWQISESLVQHKGLSWGTARIQAKRLLDQVRIADPARRMSQYPHELSGGMNQRIMIAMALAGEPDLLIADEPTTALDVTVQAQILELLNDIRRDRKMSLLLISHDLGMVSQACDRIAVMYAGQVLEFARAEEIWNNGRHPYTRGLIASDPGIAGPVLPRRTMPGTLPNPFSMPEGCAFAPRCDFAHAKCLHSMPLLRDVGGNHQVACVNAGRGAMLMRSPKAEAIA